MPADPARRQRGADGDVPPATGGARELEIGDVGAGNQQHKRHGTEQQPKGDARLPGQLLLQRHEHSRRVGEGQRNPRPGSSWTSGNVAAWATEAVGLSGGGCRRGRLNFTNRARWLRRRGPIPSSGFGSAVGARWNWRRAPDEAPTGPTRRGTVGEAAREMVPETSGNGVEFALGQCKLGAGQNAAEHAQHLNPQLPRSPARAQWQWRPKLHRVHKLE